MAYYSDSDILVTNSPGTVFLSLHCGYGQPVKTTIYNKEPDGVFNLISEFQSDISAFGLGESTELKGCVLEIMSTIHDIRNLAHGEEAEDIQLHVKVWCNETSVDTEFLKKTHGKGQLIICKYDVIIF